MLSDAWTKNWGQTHSKAFGTFPVAGAPCGRPRARWRPQGATADPSRGATFHIAPPRRGGPHLPPPGGDVLGGLCMQRPPEALPRRGAWDTPEGGPNISPPGESLQHLAGPPRRGGGGEIYPSRGPCTLPAPRGAVLGGLRVAPLRGATRNLCRSDSQLPETPSGAPLRGAKAPRSAKGRWNNRAEPSGETLAGAHFAFPRLAGECKLA